jgi:hypothetical protein
MGFCGIIPDLTVHPLNLVLYMYIHLIIISIRVLIENSHDQFRVDGLDSGRRYLEELEVFS